MSRFLMSLKVKSGGKKIPRRECGVMRCTVGVGRE